MLGKDVGTRIGALSLFTLLASCSAPGERPRPTVDLPLMARASAASVPEPPVSASAEQAPASLPPGPPSPPLDVRFERQVEAPVFALAIEKPPHVLGLGADRLWVHDHAGWHSEALPATVAPRDDVCLSVFFGRDFRARIVGSIGGPNGRRIYLRAKDGGFEPDRKEIGKLGADDVPVVAALGTADPEIVCRPGDTCLLKSVRGWKSISAPAGIQRVAVAEATGWALAGHQLYQLTDQWEPRGTMGTWAEAGALVGGRDGAYVIDTESNRLHMYDGEAWRVFESPIAHPRGMWSPDDRHFIVVGDGGLATFDGSAWRMAADAPHPLLAIAGRPGAEVYVGGPGGIFRVVLPSE